VNLLSTPTGRRVLFAALYLSEGAPIGFLWWALPTRLRAAGIPVEEITALTSLLVLPWAFKFLWAPLVDTLRTSRWSFRSWIVATQLGMGLTLLPLLGIDLARDFAALVPLLLAHAVLASTQDASIDALCIATVRPEDRGSINGWMQTGMLAGRALLGGGALFLARHLGDDGVVLLLLGLVWSSLLLVLLATKETAPPLGTRPKRGAFAIALRSAASRRETWAGLFFALVAGAGFEAVGAVAGPYLVDRGFAEEEIAFFFGVLVIAAMVLGALAGGRLSDRWGRRRSVAAFLLLLGAAIAALAIVDDAFGSAAGWGLVALLTGVYFGIGLFTAASYALFMDVTDPRLGATQFSAFMGATNGCETWATRGVGALVPRLGYPTAFVAMAAASLLALPALTWLRPAGREAGVDRGGRGMP